MFMFMFIESTKISNRIFSLSSIDNKHMSNKKLILSWSFDVFDSNLFSFQIFYQMLKSIYLLKCVWFFFVSNEKRRENFDEFSKFRLNLLNFLYLIHFETMSEQFEQYYGRLSNQPRQNNEC